MKVVARNTALAKIQIDAQIIHLICQFFSFLDWYRICPLHAEERRRIPTRVGKKTGDDFPDVSSMTMNPKMGRMDKAVQKAVQKMEMTISFFIVNILSKNVLKIFRKKPLLPPMTPSPCPLPDLTSGRGGYRETLAGGG